MPSYRSLLNDLKSTDFEKELTRVTANMYDVRDQLNRMIAEDGDYKDAVKIIAEVRDQELTEEGFIFSFLEYFRQSYENNCSGGPAAYVVVCVENKTYWDDLNSSSKLLTDTRLMLCQLSKWFERGFKIIQAKSNFLEADYDEEMYSSIDNDIQSVYKLISTARGSCSKDRMEEYKKLSSELIDPESFIYNESAKNYTINPARYSKIDVLDDYIFEIVGIEDFKSDMEETISRCGDLLNMEVVKSYVDCINTLLASVIEMIDYVNGFAEHCLEIYNGFKEGKNEAPYCFMKKLPSIGNVKGYELDKLISEDPTKYGTFYRDTYGKLQDTLNRHLKDYINCKV